MSPRVADPEARAAEPPRREREEPDPREPGAGLGIGDPWDIARLLAVFAIVLAVAFRHEPDRGRALAPAVA